MSYQPCHSEGTHKNENEIKQKIVDCCRRGVCDQDGRDIPLQKRGMAGKGSHYIANNLLGLQSTPDELIDRMRRNGIIAKK